jgi:hypothetical protein
MAMEGLVPLLILAVAALWTRPPDQNQER